MTLSLEALHATSSSLVIDAGTLQTGQTHLMSDKPLIDVDRYLDRIGLSTAPSVDLDGLATLQYAHLTAVPFENLDVFTGVPVQVGVESSLHKVVEGNRGGWCFELNGAFSALLDALGFEVALLGAAVLLHGPNAVVDHLTLEVSLDEPYLVDVGFGDSFMQPLRLNQAGPQDGGSGTFEFMASSQGTTLTRHDVEEFPEAQYRFKRTHRALHDFNAASELLQSDKSLHWHQKPIATRLLGHGADRISLTGTTLTRTVGGVVESTTLDQAEVDVTLRNEFGLTRR